ncbi:MAG: hypothetical protein HRT51_07785 [Colwellia sp.]|nr:hypothetical protein [Colwellia sp.]
MTNVFSDEISVYNKLINCVAGVFILLMILISIGNLFNDTLAGYIPEIFAWGAAFLLLSRLSLLMAVQSSILIVLSLACLFIAYQRQADFDLIAVLYSNISFITLLASISFLKLIASPNDTSINVKYHGKKALISTIIGAHLFSAVINLSAIFLVAERLKTSRAISQTLLMLLTRAFSSAAFWSPFFAAMGIALIYSPEASLMVLMLQGMPLAIVALGFTYWEINSNNSEEVKLFIGYPLNIKALFVPAVLVMGVLSLHHLKPTLPIVLIVAALSILLTVILCFIKYPAKNAVTKLYKHTTQALPNMSSELILFLSAGLLSFSVNTLLPTFDSSLPVNEFTYFFAVGLLFLMIILSIFGVHPVVSISIVGVWITPLNADPNALGLVFLCAWGIGMIISPLSGMNVTLANHYALTYQQIVKWHAKYALLMFIASSLLLLLVMKGQW